MAAMRIGATLCPRMLSRYFMLHQRFPQNRLLLSAATCMFHHHAPQLHTATCLLNRGFLVSCQTQRPISTTTATLRSKNFDVKKLQKYNIYDPQGNYMLTSELFNVEKFCDAYRKFKYEVWEGTKSTKGEAGLESLHIVEKPAKEHAHADKVKLVKMKSAEAPWTVDRIKKVLLEHGTVLLDIRGKQSASVKKVIEDDWISKLCTISTVKEEERSILLKITAPDTIDGPMFKKIFLESAAKETAYLEQVKDMLAQTADTAAQ